jgi:hypothetical protein
MALQSPDGLLAEGMDSHTVRDGKWVQPTTHYISTNEFNKGWLAGF